MILDFLVVCVFINYCLVVEDECNVFASPTECHNGNSACVWDISDVKCKFNCKHENSAACGNDPHGCQWVNYNDSGAGECFNVNLVHDCSFFTDGRQKECGCNDFWKDCVLSQTEGLCHYTGVTNMRCLNFDGKPSDCLAEPHCVFQYSCVAGIRTSESCISDEVQSNKNDSSNKKNKKGLSTKQAVLLVAIVVPVVVVVIVVIAVLIAVAYYRIKVIKIKNASNSSTNGSVGGAPESRRDINNIAKIESVQPEPMAIQEEEEVEISSL